MSRTPKRTIAPDSQLRTLSDDDLLDFLARARLRLAGATVPGAPAPTDAPGFQAAVAALELEATRRGLERPAPHERMPLKQALRRLAAISPCDSGGEWARLLAELDLPGLWAAYLYAQDSLALPEREFALARIALAVDRIVYGEQAAHARWLRNVELPADGASRLSRLNAALEATFGLIFDRLAGSGDEPAAGDEGRSGDVA